MARTTFLSNEVLWQILSTQIKSAEHVEAAIAYFGQGGAKLLPLRKGDRLVVDMSLATVKTGGTDPREIEKLFKKGVEIFSRRNLHAKIILLDNNVIVGSANVSKRSYDVLDEAAILTTDPLVIKRTQEFIDRLCTEPVQSKYLEQCKQLYRLPRIIGKRSSETSGQQRVKHAKLWMVNLVECSVPESEIERYEQGERKAQELIKDSVRSETDSFHWSSKPKMADELEFGDWVIEVITYKDKTILVYPTAQLLFIDHYVRESKSGKQRYVFHVETPKRGQTLTWKEFCKKAKSILGLRELSKPRTQPIRDIQIADELLRFWTPGGRVAKRR